MEANNLFLNMNSDLSKYIQNNDKYLKALNLRPITSLGQSSGGLVNTKGNKCEITFPTLRAVYKFKIFKKYVSGVFQPGLISLTINGQTTQSININENTSPKDIVSYLRLLNNCYNGTFANTKTFSTAYDNDYFYIYQMAEYRLCTANPSFEPNITVNNPTLNSGLYYINNLGESVFNNAPYINTQSNNDPVVILGSTTINNNIYLYTCTETNSQKTGQIWELVYNETLKISILKLLYHSYLSFNINYPIPTTASTGRFETDSLQRIYFSDNNNPVRSVNVKDPNLFALDYSLLNLSSSVKFSVPTLKQINDTGAVNNLITSNSYFCAYRLVKNNGSISNYSIISNPVTLIPQDTSKFIGTEPNFSSLEGYVTEVDKTITWEVNNLDTNYDKIEFIIIIKDWSNNEGHSIYKYEEKLINNSSSITTTFTNDTDNFIPIEDSEFSIDNSTFTHCKSLEQKDNRLFYANIKNSLGEYLDTFDTRAYRFKSNSNNLYVKKYTTDDTSTLYSINSNTDYNLLDSLADNIPLYNLGMSNNNNSLYDKDSKYKKNSNIIGGEGPNISFSFGNILLRTDLNGNSPNPTPSTSDFNQGSTRDNIASSHTYKHGYRLAHYVNHTMAPFYNNGSPEIKFYNPNYKMSMGFEYFSGNYRSYQLNEIYRFAIVFKSKTGTSSFAKHICDVKFPNYRDAIDPSLKSMTQSGNQVNDFRSLYYDSSDNTVYSNICYIEFKVNIPEQLANLIDGYEIVRVERKNSDKTIGSTGLINQVMVGIGSELSNYFLPISHYVQPGGTDSLDPSTYNESLAFNGQQCKATSKLLSFHSFDYLCNKTASLISPSDELIITEKYKRTTNPALWPLTTAGPPSSFEEYYYQAKYYNLDGFIYTDNETLTLNQQIKQISQSEYVDKAGVTNNITLVNGVYKNYNYQWSGGSSTTYDSDAYSLGSPSIILALTDSNKIQWEDYNSSGSNVVNGNSKLLAIHFKPGNLISQYGGNNYLARSNNEYISTGAYRRVEDIGQTNIKVFGGDIFHGILDIQRAIKNFGNDGVSVAPTKHSQTWFFPTQSVYNIDLRSGIHVNTDLSQNDGTFASGNDEYIYHTGYSASNNIRKYLPKPDFFNSTSVYNNLVYWSEVKINGENNDSFGIVLPSSNYSVDGNYGEITALLNLRNDMIFIQENAIGRLLINPTSIITDENNLPLRLGDGGILNKHFYFDTNSGSKHQWSICKSSNNVLYADVKRKKINLFNGESIVSISDTKNNRGFFNKIIHDKILLNDNPIKYSGILSTYDSVNNEFLITFLNKFNNGEDVLDEKYTISYSELVNNFTTFYSFTPYIYINNGSLLYSPKDYSTVSNTSKVYIHEKGNYSTYYDVLYPSTLKFIINNDPIKTKTFDNLVLNTESIKDNIENIDDINDVISSENINYLDDSFLKLRLYNEYQNTDWFSLNNTNSRKVEQEIRVQLPRNKVDLTTNNINSYSIFDPSILTKNKFGDRLRDKYVILDLYYDNSKNNRFIINNVKSIYRNSDR